MNFWSSDLGHVAQGTVVEVSLTGNAANVMLVDSSNFADFKSGRSYRYTGGLVKSSPVRLAAPNSGHWYVVINYGGYEGRGTASVKVLSRR